MRILGGIGLCEPGEEKGTLGADDRAESLLKRVECAGFDRANQRPDRDETKPGAAAPVADRKSPATEKRNTAIAIETGGDRAGTDGDTVDRFATAHAEQCNVCIRRDPFVRIRPERFFERGFGDRIARARDPRNQEALRRQEPMAREKRRERIDQGGKSTFTWQGQGGRPYRCRPVRRASTGVHGRQFDGGFARAAVNGKVMADHPSGRRYRILRPPPWRTGKTHQSGQRDADAKLPGKSQAQTD